MRPLVYVAGPITGDPWGCVRRALVAQDELVTLGFDVYLPQLSVLAEIVRHRPYQYYIDQGLAMVEHCDGLYRLGGDSPGADMEVEHAVNLGMPVGYEDGLRFDITKWGRAVESRYKWRKGGEETLSTFDSGFKPGDLWEIPEHEVKVYHRRVQGDWEDLSRYQFECSGCDWQHEVEVVFGVGTVTPWIKAIIEAHEAKR